MVQWPHPEVPIIACANTAEYRNTVPSCVTPDDIVLEVGSANGLTVEIISRFCSSAVGVDKSAAEVSDAVTPSAVVAFEYTSRCGREGMIVRSYGRESGREGRPQACSGKEGMASTWTLMSSRSMM